MKATARKDNSAGLAKVRIRERIAEALPTDARVLEFFAGEGLLWRSVWQKFGGATMDRDKAKAERAARERKRWAVYHGDTIEAVRRGWMAHVPFAVLDIDAWGEPWPALHAWLMSDRKRAPRTRVVLTDGHRARASLNLSRFLFPDAKKRTAHRKHLNWDGYMLVVMNRMKAWARSAFVSFEEIETIHTGKNKGIDLHSMTIVDRR